MGKKKIKQQKNMDYCTETKEKLRTRYQHESQEEESAGRNKQLSLWLWPKEQPAAKMKTPNS